MCKEQLMGHANQEKLSCEQKEQLNFLKDKCALFNHADQINLCVKLIALACEHIGETQLNEIKDPKMSDINFSTRKKLIKTLIRISSESSNYGQTIDFVTVEALNEKVKKNLESSKVTTSNAMRKGDAKSSPEIFIPIKNEYKEKLSHEHMVPCEVVFNKIMELKVGEDLTTIMNAVGFRALIYREDKGEKATEHALLDANFKEKMPEYPLSDKDFPLEYYPFARYEAVGIYSSLIGVSARGVELLKKYNEDRYKYLDTNNQWKSR